MTKKQFLLGEELIRKYDLCYIPTKLIKSIFVENDGVSNEYRLFRPKHSQDMNYYLVDMLNGKAYLIDIGDVYDRDAEDAKECYEAGGIIWEDLREINDFESLIEAAWKTYDVNEEN